MAGEIVRRSRVVDNIRRILDAQAEVGAFLARAWRKYGAEFNQHVDGAYGLVVVNKETRGMLVNQWSLGIHPIFYRFVRNTLAIESSLKKWQLGILNLIKAI